jgi:hypothetical protein
MMILDSYRFGSNSCPSYTPGLYTAEEIDTLINVDGYIPVASAAEFDDIRTGVAETMGAGTCWEDTYTTGDNKKYIQVEDLDFTATTGWTSINIATGLIYDGNELLISNLTVSSANAGLFTTASTPMTFKNVRAADMSLNKSGINCGLIEANGSGGIIDNVIISNSTITSTGRTAAICGAGDAIITNCEANNVNVNGTTCYGISGGASTIDGCSVLNSDINGTGSSAGIGDTIVTNSIVGGTTIDGGGSLGVCGITTYFGSATIENNIVFACTITVAGSIVCGISQARSGALIRKCRVENTNINVSGSQTRIGGISGLYFSGGTIRECEVINCNIDAPNSTGVGGIVGYDQSNNTNIIDDCRVVGGTVNGNSDVGGIMGRALQSNTTNTNSFSTAAVTGSSNTGGAYGRYAGATITGVYWDTVASSNATSAAGTGQTTSALQTPTSNTGIYSAYTIPPWAFGTASEYPTLTTTP